jgi:hypothetical protein
MNAEGMRMQSELERFLSQALETNVEGWPRQDSEGNSQEPNGAETKADKRTRDFDTDVV